MDKNKEKAWSYLTDKEKQSIYLTLGHGLSGCQAGEVLTMTHYKYVELKARSESLFKLFTDYFEKYTTLIRAMAPIKPQLRDYIYGCIEKRLSLQEAYTYAGEGRWSIRKIRTVEILEGMKILSTSNNQHDNDLHTLIQEFDRWNNFRILPYELQAPSPYKRKSNRQAKAYFAYLKKMPTNIIDKIVRTLWYKGKNPLYIALFNISVYPEDGYGIIPVKNCKKTICDLNIRRIYLFDSIALATEFALTVLRQPSISTPKEGLRFWSEYNDIIRKSLNYEAISHTNKINDYFDDAFKKSYK